MVSFSVLSKQDDVATGATIDVLQKCSLANDFTHLAASETQDILDRDQKDEDALKVGIKFAQDKGVLSVLNPIPVYKNIDVLGKTADKVAEEILSTVGEENCKKGCVLTLVGLSGTGKGTTVSKMKEHLESKYGKGKATAWSNGNLFRCLTLLACEFVEKSKGSPVSEVDEYGTEIGKPDGGNKILTDANLKEWSSKKHMNFEKRTLGSDESLWDVKLTRLDGSVVWVSEVCNTLLKEPRISKTIPLVASKTQGEVVLFAGDACSKMGADGTVVLVEGREPTVNFMPTQHRFCLTISDTQLIGKRRAAQRVLGMVLAQDCKDDSKVCEIILECLKKAMPTK